MSGEYWSIILVTLVGGGSVFGVFLKLTFGQREQASTRYVDGHRAATAAKDTEIAAMRLEFQQAINRVETQRMTDLTGLRDQVSRLHRALAQLVPLVAAEHQTEAIAVLVELGLPAPSTGDPTP